MIGLGNITPGMSTLRDIVDLRDFVDLSRDLGSLGMISIPQAPLFVDPRRLLLDMAREHALPDLLRLVVDRLAESPRVALARIWLVQPTEDCTGCPMATECC